MRTAPVFMISDDRDFEIEKDRLIEHIEKTQNLGPEHFEGKESYSFGPLTTQEWNTLFPNILNTICSNLGYSWK